MMMICKTRGSEGKKAANKFIYLFFTSSLLLFSLSCVCEVMWRDVRLRLKPKKNKQPYKFIYSYADRFDASSVRYYLV